MQYRKLGSSGIEASVVGLGAWVLGGGSVWGTDTADGDSVRAIQSALDAGINLIDTAPAYGFGRSEEVVGRAIQGRRDQVVLASKCGLWWDDTRGSYFCEFDGRSLYRSLRPDTIRIELENSLRRLGTDRIDLYQTHWPATPPDQTPIEDTMSCLLQLQHAGKIRAIGVCNVSPSELEEHCACGAIASAQFRYSLLFREPEHTLLPRCRTHGIATLTYMSLEQGLLTGKVGMDRTFSAGEFRSNEAWNPWYKPANRQRVLDLLAGLAPLQAKYGCSTAQLVLAWTLAQPGVTHVLAGARTATQVQENAGAGALSLTAEDVATISAARDRLGVPA